VVTQKQPSPKICKTSIIEIERMPKLGPIKHKQLVKYLRLLGFDGPYGQGRPHSIMIRGDVTLTIPNKHGSGAINDVGLLRRILRQAGVSAEEWETL